MSLAVGSGAMRDEDHLHVGSGAIVASGSFVSGSGSAVTKTEDHLHVGSGSFVASGSGMSVCSGSISIKIISWKECDTLSKKIGYIFGHVINFMSNIVTKTYRGIIRVIKMLYIDKVFEVFYNIIKGISRKLYNLATVIFKKCIKPIFINRVTEKIGNLINDYLIKPIYEIITGIFRKISDALFKASPRNNEMRYEQDSIIVKIFIKFQNFIKAILKPIYNWTLLPLYNRILSPILNAIGDIFIGMLGGFAHNEKKDDKQKKEIKS